MNKETKSNLVLIGMPGSGKSTIGVILAKRLSHDFVDTDVLIQTSEHRSLQDILDQEGYEALRDIEEHVLLELDVENHIISTGGSVVYSEPAMQHLKKDGIVIFLDVSLETLKSRLSDYETRGIAKRPEQSFADLFEERASLYHRYADITMQCDGLRQDQICDQICARLNDEQVQFAQ